MSKKKQTHKKSTGTPTVKGTGTKTVSSKKKTAKASKGYSISYEGRLSVIIPVYHDDTKELVTELKRFSHAWKKTSEVLLVNASGDAALVEQLQADIKDLENEQNSYQIIASQATTRGKAIKEALNQVGGDHVLLADGNLGISLLQVADWVDGIDHSDCLPNDKIWIGSRRDAASKSENGSGLLAARVYNWGVQLFTSLNLRDTQAQYMVMPAGYAKELYAASPGAKDVEILYQADLKDIKIEEKVVEWEHPDNYISSAAEVAKKTIGLFATRFLTRLSFFFLSPFKELKTAENGIPKKESPLFRFAFAAGSLLLLFLMCMLSFDYGITGDEVLQKNYGDDVLAYFETGGKNKKCLEWELLAYYGGLFDYMSAWLNKNIGGLDPYDMRHLLNAIFGFVAILFAARTGRAVSGSWRVALLTLIFLALSPRFFGHSMNNPKDIPFATGFLISVYYLVQLTKQLPRPSVKSMFMLAMGIGLTINVRSGGIILMPYMAIFMAGWVILRKDMRPMLTKFKIMPLANMLAVFLGVSALGYWAGTWFWPYAQQDIMGNPFKALGEMTKYSVGIRMLWGGYHLWSDQLPWYYIPQWLIMSSPIAVLAGFPLIFGIFFSPKHKERWLIAGLALFTSFFPVAYAIYKKSSLYDGMRHFLFVYPILAMIAAYGWVILTDFIKNKIAGILIAVIVAGLLILPLRWMVVSHPHEYVYFNEAFGGLKKAYGQYETDYYMNSMRPMADWMIENEPKVKAGHELIIATNAAEPLRYYFSKYPNVTVLYVRYHERVKAKYDYLITYSRFVSHGFIHSGAWPPGEVVYKEEVDGVPLGCITKASGRNMKGYEADQAFKKRDYETGLRLLEEVVAEDPKNESALLLLTQYYPQLQQDPQRFAKMKGAIDKLMLLADDYVNGLGMVGVYYLNVNQLDSARVIFQRAVDLNYKYTFGFFHLGNIAAQKDKDYPTALAYLMKYDEFGGQPPQGYDLAIQVAQALQDRKHTIYFQAKKMAMANNHNEAYKLLGQVLGIDPEFEPAKKMKKAYEDATKQQQMKEQNKRFEQETGD